MYYIYHKETSAIHEITRHRPYRVTRSYKSMAAAKAAITRMSKAWWDKAKQNHTVDHSEDPVFTYGIAEADYYHKNIERKVRRTNIMTGKTYWESVNTPRACSPSSELYWSM